MDWTTSDVITVSATKIVCENESELPNWATAGNPPTSITATTATEWLAQEGNESCDVVSGWDFQWGDQSTIYPENGDIAVDLYPGYQTFGEPTGENGVASVVIPIAEINQLHFAEVQKEGYIPFTSQSNPGNTNDMSAEFYCATDVANYDNYEGLGMPEDQTEIVAGEHYHCIAFNALKTTEEPAMCDPQVNLIENGGFEAPVLSNGTWSIISDSSILKWLVAWAAPLQPNGTLGLEIQNNVAGAPFAGNQHAELDGDHPVTIWQDVPTVPGKEYSFSFKYSPRPGVALADNSLQVKIDGSVLGADIATDGTANGNTVWEDITRTFVATSATTKVEIYDNGTDSSLGGYVDNADLRCVGEPQEEGRGKIHTIKFIDGVRATVESADNAMFSMFINPSDGDFMLKSNGWVDGDGPYEATTFVHKKGSTFTIDENLSTDLVGASCQEGKPFALAGYSTASTYEDAIVAPQSTVAPAITIDGDKYLIVHNISCVENPQVPGKGKIHVIKFINGVRATAESADNVSFPMDINNPDGDFVLKPTGWVVGDGVYEATTHVHKKGSMFTIAENLTTPLVGASCQEDKPYALEGYSTAATYEGAIAAQKTEIAPNITIDGDQYLIVHNTKCGDVQAHVYKYLRNGQGLDAQIPNESTVTPFPMTSTWQESDDVTPIVGYYTLGVYNGGAPLKYASLTANMEVGSDYATSEQTGTGYVLAPGAQCVPNMYRLVGYKKGIGSLAAAQAAPLTEDASFTNLSDDAYIIVVNEDCDDLPPVLDICPNLQGNQSVVPTGYYLDGEECLQDILTDGGGGGGDENTGGGRGGRRSSGSAGGTVLGASTTAADEDGQVLGASMCSEYIHSYIKFGQSNDKADVIRLQAFLNTYMGSLLMTTGVYDQQTFDVLKAFQVKEAGQVLQPWKQTPGGINESGTGYVYKTTKRWINMIKCPELNLAIPSLTH